MIGLKLQRKKQQNIDSLDRKPGFGVTHKYILKIYRFFTDFLTTDLLPILQRSLHKTLTSLSRITSLGFVYSRRYVRNHKILVNSTLIISVVVAMILSSSNFSDAAYSYWIQSDWSGGVGSSTTNQYSSGSNVNTSVANQATLSTTGSPNWYNTAWQYRNTITFNNTTANLGTTAETLTNFPVLIQLTSSNFNFSEAQSAGQDIRFTASDGTTLLSYEIEAWSNSSQTASIWVKVPSIAATSSGTIEMYYGNSSASDAQTASSVWSGYAGVWHLNNPTNPIDSTGNGNNGTNNNSVGAVAGQIAGAASFASGSYINTTNIAAMNNTTTLTISAWMKRSTSSSIVDLGKGDGTAYESMELWSDGNAYFELGNGGTTYGDVNLTGTGWHYVVMVFDGSQTGNAARLKAYVDGAQQTLGYNGTIPASTGTNTFNLDIGRYYQGTTTTGDIDEVRVSTTNHDAAWNAAEYKTETSGFTSFSSQQAVYPTSGTLTSNIFNTNLENNWGDLTYADSLPSGTSISVLVRAGNQSNLSDAPAFTSCSPIASGGAITSTCAPDKSQYVQYQVTLSTSNTANTPELTSVSIAFTPSDVTPPPTNASAIAMQDGSGGASVASDGWANVDPYFSWTAGADDVGGSGIQGYCLYLGQDSTGNPVTTEGDLGTSPVNTGGTCPFVISSTSINTAISGYLGTALTSSNSLYYLNIKAIDNADNVYNGSSAQFEFMYDNTPPANPAFITAPSEFVSNDQVTLTWPTTGSDSASDANSGIAGLQYRIGSGGTWYGANHTGSQDATDLLPNNGSYTTISNPDFANLVQGDNIVYFRTWDNAGNISSAYVTTVIKINTTAPSSPQNLEATPTTNTTNSFGFSWLAPATFTGSASNITYCYTVNTLPTSTNCTYTAGGQTSLSTGAYATEPGDNTLYLVAKDEAGNINYATAANVTFTANTPAPGIPLNTDIADISVKSTSTWKLAISWDTPSTVGAGIANYKVFRSTDGVSYSQIASTAGTSYVDTGLSQQTYYYKIEACDSANNCGAQTDPVSDFPTGKFTSPANLISGPDSSVTTRTATISWTTDRTSNSSIEYGLSSGNYFNTDASNSDQVTSHSVELNSLTAGTTYFYRALWTDEDGNIGTSSEGSFTTLPAPTVSNVTSGNIDLTNATIQFTANNASAVKLEYGGGVLSDSQTLNTSTSTSTYSIPLNNLNPGTTYTFRLDPFDNSGNIYTSPDSYTFATPPQPTITNVEFSPVTGALTGTEQISWTTNVPTTSQISYGLVNGAKSNQLDTDLTTTHTMTISDLSYDTQYSVIATSIDNLGNVANSDLQIFKSGIDTRPPIISDIQIQPSITGNGASAEGQLIVSWKTDKPGTSQVAYGDGVAGDYSTKTAVNTAIVNNHVVVISNLGTAEVYHLQAISDDADGIKGVSGDQTTIIGQASDSALSIVFNSLQSIFGL